MTIGRRGAGRLVRPASRSSSKKGWALPSAAGTSGPSMSITALSMPSAAAAAIRCSMVRTRTPKAPIVVAELVSTT